MSFPEQPTIINSKGKLVADIHHKSSIKSNLKNTMRTPLMVNKPPAEFGKIVGEINILFEKRPVFDLSPQSSDTIFDLDVKANRGKVTKKEIDNLNKWFKKNKKNAVRVYHGTSSDHPIMDKGLLPTTLKTAKSLQSGHGYVYLSYDPSRAEDFGIMTYPMKNVTVYSVDIPISQLKPDVDQLANKRMYGCFDMGQTLAESLLYGSGFRVKGKIEPWQIKVHKEIKASR